MKTIWFLIFLAYVSTSTGNPVINVYNSIEEFKVKHPDAKLIKLYAEDSDIDGTRSYTLGTRQTGDSVVANSNNKQSWPVPHNVTTLLSYPSTGTNGAFLTYILINCEQSSNIGQAYVTYGGVGQHFIQIIIEARVTTYFNYAAFFYGIK